MVIQSLWRSLRELHFWSANKLAPPLLRPPSLPAAKIRRISGE